MKYFLYISIVIYLICSGNVSSATDFTRLTAPEFVGTQLGPIYFLYPVPSKIAILERLDLSFYKSSLIKTYRYRVEIPSDGATTIDKSLTAWTDWTTEELSRILIPRLDLEGRYRLLIEYKTSSGTNTRKFEKVFSVYSSPTANAVASARRTPTGTRATIPRTIPSNDRTASQITAVAERTAVQTPPTAARTNAGTSRSTDRTETQTTPATNREPAETSRLTNRTETQTTPATNREPAETSVSTERTEAQTTPVESMTGMETSETTDRSAGQILQSAERTASATISSSSGTNVNSAPADTVATLIPAQSTPGESENQIPDLARQESSNSFTANERMSSLVQAMKKRADSLALLEETEERTELKQLTVKKIAQDISSTDTIGEVYDTVNIERNKNLFESVTANVMPAQTYHFRDLTAEAAREIIPYNDDMLSLNYVLPASEGNNASETETDSVFIAAGEIFNAFSYNFSAGYNLIPDPVSEIGTAELIDPYGNSPLHVAVLSADEELISSLIDRGTNLNIKNTLEMAPLHLAVITGNIPVVKNLLNKGAEINLEGNSGYTPLHIAAEMNHIKMAELLLSMGATRNMKTDQKLTAAEIAKIQENNEILKLLHKKDSLSSELSLSQYHIDKSNLNRANQTERFEFNLPFDDELVRKRRLNKVLQFVTIPVFALSVFESVYFKSEADHSYYLSKTAETEEMAKYYYDKTARYDKNFYISGGISLISVYGFIHSTLSKKNISGKMRKTFY